jgi:hypothetical protein
MGGIFGFVVENEQPVHCHTSRFVFLARLFPKRASKQ